MSMVNSSRLKSSHVEKAYSICTVAQRIKCRKNFFSLFPGSFRTEISIFIQVVHSCFSNRIDVKNVQIITKNVKNVTKIKKNVKTLKNVTLANN